MNGEKSDECTTISIAVICSGRMWEGHNYEEPGRDFGISYGK